ncbi:MAG: hypothetical protein ABI211_30195 [Vicinamibacterales bacterium]
MQSEAFADPFTLPLPNGIDADTGEPLSSLEPRSIRGVVVDEQRQDGEAGQQAQIKLGSEQATFAVVPDVDINDVSSAGWGVVFAAGADPRIQDALQPLLLHRQAQAGKLYRAFTNLAGYRPAESTSQWLGRHGTRLDVVEPLDGVPFYLMLVGSPDDIPLEFQYLLDIHWGVGRLYFPTLEEYRQYADSVVAYETAGRIDRGRRVTVFATAHEGDRATQSFAAQVATPLTSASERGPIGARQRFELDTLIGDPATRGALLSRLQGRDGVRPSLLVTGSHGIVFKSGDPRQVTRQGAALCQDWPGIGPALPEHVVAAEDLGPDAHVHGLIHFSFACYSAGWPELDTFSNDPAARKRVAPRSEFARFPQRLLAHPNGGALAVIGHVDRAWTYSFQSSRGPQAQSFRDVITRLLRGERIGAATDTFNVRWAGLSSELSELIREMQFGMQVSESQLASYWIARNDARNYVVLGDPAVRLRVEDL